jgi:putative membrane protein
MAHHDRVLIVCIDRDGDIETKIGENGPILGRKKVLEAATKLGLADPAESDTNVLFAGVKLFDELTSKYKNLEIAALTGSRKVGVESDLIISKQLDKALKSFNAGGVVLVSDGAEDEHVLPLIQSRAKIISLKRVVVKQSEALESTYYILLDFLKEVTGDPKLARLVIGVPGIALILFMFLGPNAWRVIFGVVGILLVIKGFNLEEPLERNIASLRENLVTDKASFFTYIIAALVALVGLLRGYQSLSDTFFATYIDAIPIFISASKDLLTSAGLLALAGRSIDAVIEGRNLGKYLILATFLVSLWFIVGAISSFILRTITMGELVVSATIGAALSLTAFLLRRALSKAE